MPILEALSLAMNEKEDSVTIALQGDHAGSTNGDLNVRSNPLPNFFALYGLAFETASKALGDTSLQTRSISSLRAMQSLVRVDYCGTMLFTSSIFDELCTLSYRIATTESAPVRTEMVKVMASFASSRGVFGDQESIRRTLAIVAYALRSAIGSEEKGSTCKLTWQSTPCDILTYHFRCSHHDGYNARPSQILQCWVRRICRDRAIA